jgi:acyl carrier protein
VPDQLAAVITWIASRRALTLPIDPDLDLIDSRLIDSLDFAEFLFVLEEALGRPIDFEAHEMDSFRTLRRIANDILAAALE